MDKTNGENSCTVEVSAQALVAIPATTTRPRRFAAWSWHLVGGNLVWDGIKKIWTDVLGISGGVGGLTMWVTTMLSTKPPSALVSGTLALVGGSIGAFLYIIQVRRSRNELKALSDKIDALSKEATPASVDSPLMSTRPPYITIKFARLRADPKDVESDTVLVVALDVVPFGVTVLNKSEIELQVCIAGEAPIFFRSSSEDFTVPPEATTEADAVLTLPFHVRGGTPKRVKTLRRIRTAVQAQRVVIVDLRWVGLGQTTPQVIMFENC